MALPTINFNRAKGGLGRPTAGFDHYSGLLFYSANATLPTGYGTDRVKQYFSLEDAETDGIVEGDANFGVLWYHVSEFFRINEKGVLYVGIYYPQGDVGFVDFASHDFAEVTLMQDFAEGKIRQLGVYEIIEGYDTNVIGALNTQAVAVATNYRPMSILYAGDISGVSDLTTLADISARTDKYVSVVIGQDGGGTGKALFDSKGYSITTLGATLGTISFASVHQSIAKTDASFNLADALELSIPAFANGDLYKDNIALAEGLNDKNYIFIKNFTDYFGTYHSDTWTATAKSGDFATIENNRTIEKAVRLTYSGLLPLLNSELYVNADGTLTEDTIKTFQSFADRGIEQMLTARELSAKQVIIDPTQDVLATSEIKVTLKLVPVGVARTITVNIGFVANL